MPDQQLPDDFLERLKLVTRRRPKAVIDHILTYGFVTTEELATRYGYEHAPRAARDVREEGIPLETFRVKSSSGRSIGAYRFGDLSLMRKDRVGGRVAFSKKFKQELTKRDGSRCAVCSTAYEDRYLQVDHRIPYEVAGDAPRDYQHIALRSLRRLDVVWEQDETAIYDQLKQRAQAKQEYLPDYVKAALREHLGEAE